MSERTATKVGILSGTRVKTLAIVGFGAAGVAAALLSSAMNSTMPSKIADVCGEYGQSICLPCKESLIVSDTRTCTCETGYEYQEKLKQCVKTVEPIRVIAKERSIDTTLRPENFLGDLSSATLARTEVTLPAGVYFINSVIFQLHDSSGSSPLQLPYVTGYRLRAQNQFGEIIGEDIVIQPISALKNTEADVIFDYTTTKKEVLYKGLPTETPLTFSLIADVYSKSGSFEGKSTVFSILGSNQSQKFQTKDRPNQDFTVTISRDERISVKPKTEEDLTTEIELKGKEGASVPLARALVTLPGSVDRVVDVTFEPETKTAFPSAFQYFTLNVKNAKTGERIGSSAIWTRQADSGKLHFDTIAGQKVNEILKGLPTQTQLLFEVVASTSPAIAKSLPSAGRLQLSGIYALGDRKKYTLEQPVLLQQYRVSLKDSPTASLPERISVSVDTSGTISARVDSVPLTVMFGSFTMTLPKDARNVRGMFFTESEAKELAAFEEVAITVYEGNREVGTFRKYERPTGNRLAFEKVGESIFSDLPTGVPLIVYVFGRVDEKGLASLPANGRLTLNYIRADNGNLADKQLYRYYGYEGAVQLQSYRIEKPATLSQQKCEPLYVYETNPADKTTLTSWQPNLARCPSDRDPSRWDVAPWKGYVETQTPAQQNDPEKCYDEYRARWISFGGFEMTSPYPNFAIYTKKTAGTQCQ